MSMTRRKLLAAGGVATGMVATHTLATPTPAAAAVTTDRDAFNVKEAAFGALAAVGDGDADDTEAIQGHLNVMALFGGGTVYFPIGTYKVSSAITVPAGVNIVCAGSSKLGGPGNRNSGFAGTATLLGDTGFTDTILKTPSMSGQTVASIISNLRVAGKSDASSDRPSVFFDQGNFITVENCSFVRRGREVVMVRSGIMNFLYNSINGHGVAGCVGLVFDGVDSRITGNDITANGHCFEHRGEANVVFGNMCFNSNRGAGIFISSVRSTFVSNRTDENAGPGFLVQGSHNVITGNNILLNGVEYPNEPVFPGPKAGVEIASGQGNAVTGNAFSNWCHDATRCNTQEYGVALTGNCSNNAVTGNTFTLQGTGGVLNTSTGPGNVISGNAGQP